MCIYAVVFPSEAVVHHSFANEYLASILALVTTLYLVRAIDAFPTGPELKTQPHHRTLERFPM